MSEFSRRRYGGMFGPTTGDRLRLADTSLVIEVERDLTLAGEEATFGGGKSIREGMAQGAATRAEGVMDLVITNALILDHWGVVKADIGVRDGHIAVIGKAGNPDTMDDVTVEIGASTEIIAGEGKLVTAGGIDTHIHFISPAPLKQRHPSASTPTSLRHTSPPRRISRRWRSDSTTRSRGCREPSPRPAFPLPTSASSAS